jgi:hypothetical protein
MSEEARTMRRQGLDLIEKAKAICDHANHRHNWEENPDVPGYTCDDCGEYGFGYLPDTWPCSHRPMQTGAST